PTPRDERHRPWCGSNGAGSGGRPLVHHGGLCEPRRSGHGRPQEGTMMRSVATTLALVGLGALTACAVTDDGLEPAEGWTEPGWMAKARQQEDAYAQGMISCYAEYGLEATRI